MALFRSTVIAAALMASAHASASLLTYSVKGTLTAPVSPDLIALYQIGTPLSGIFTIDDAAPAISYPDQNWYFGAFSGTFNVGSNVVSVSSSLAYSFAPGNYTSLTMLGGNAWNTGGTISGSQSAGNLQLNGLQLRFFYQDSLPKDTPLKTLLADANLQFGDFYLNYVDATGRSVGDSWQITEMTPLSAVPEPDSTVLLLSGGVIMLAAGMRRRRQGQVARATDC